MCSTEHHQHWAGPSPALPTGSHSTHTAVLLAQALISPSLGTEIKDGAGSQQAGRSSVCGPGEDSARRSAVPPPAPGAGDAEGGPRLLQALHHSQALCPSSSLEAEP